VPDDHSEPPVARRQPTISELHGEQRIDDYAWMHDDAAGLRDYLAAERRYYDLCIAHNAILQRSLYDEMTNRLAPTDRSVSWPHGLWLYYTRRTSGKQYQDFCRSPAAGGGEQLLLSSNDLAKGHDYFALGICEVSPDDRWLAYSVDVTGDEVYELKVRDLETGADLPDGIARSYYGFAWSADSTQFLYTVHDDAYRPYLVCRHTLGTPTSTDVTVFEEPDQRFEVTVKNSRSGDVAIIDVLSRNTAEVWLIPTGDLSAPPRCVAPRRDRIEYAVDHLPGDAGGRLVIVTNDGATDFRVMTAPTASSGSEHWTELIAPAPDERLLAVDAFSGYVVISLRRDGCPALRILDLADRSVRDIDAPPTSSIVLAEHDREHQPVHDPFGAAAVTVVMESLIDPPTWWSVQLATGERTQLKQESVPNYDSATHQTERLTATAKDGAQIPITVARPATATRAAPAPLLLYGYGSYESCVDPSFDLVTASLLDRGIGYAIAHIRGGGERGRTWWFQGRLHDKPTTFDDFVTVADHLASLDWVDGTRIASRGVSAGGLLQGAVFSRAPQRWRAVVAEVPFVDVVTTMLDPSLPLTIAEYDEWGNPNEPADYAVMRSYSPYENDPGGPRPALLVTGSLHDARVLIREPAKWVARLRATQTSDSVLLFRPELGAAAHFGASGRLDRLRYEAEIAAFVLEAFDVSSR
jgi:oligopeptidase B